MDNVKAAQPTDIWGDESACSVLFSFRVCLCVCVTQGYMLRSVL